jgi:hypothetical protein
MKPQSAPILVSGSGEVMTQHGMKEASADHGGIFFVMIG